MPSAAPSLASQAASTASCTSFTFAGESQPAPNCATPARVPAACSAAQLITGARLKMPSKSLGKRCAIVRPSRPPSELPMKVELPGGGAVTPLHHVHRDVAHLLVGGVGEVRQRFVVQREGLQRHPWSVLVAGVGAVGHE